MKYKNRYFLDFLDTFRGENRKTKQKEGKFKVFYFSFLDSLSPSQPETTSLISCLKLFVVSEYLNMTFICMIFYQKMNDFSILLIS